MNEEEFFNKYVMGNPFDFKKSIIAHCRTLDKYDVYQWVADDEVKIKNLLEENQQLKEKLELSEKARKDVYDYINFLVIIDTQLAGGRFKDTIWGKELLEILDIDKGGE